jgi:methanogenic corrinoid protein MtbC1
MSANLNIAALTHRTGVPPDTIRKWEQRYAVLQPVRTAGGQRRYSELDVARIEWLKARLDEGYRIGEAAKLLGSGYPVVAGTQTELVSALVEATVRADVNGLARLVEQTLSAASLEDAFVGSLTPALTEVGALWELGQIGVAQEHLATGTVRSALQRLLSDPRGGLRGTAVLACAPGEHHEIGLLMLAVLLRADGWQVAYLGPDTPCADAIALAGTLDARALCLSATLATSAQVLADALSVERVPTTLSVVIGGAGAPKRMTLGGTRAQLRKLAA